MKKIKLTQNKYALVDDSDFEYLNQWKWYYNQGYAVRNSGTYNGKRKTLCMHREILNAPHKLEIDHIDGNGLNNQRHNLRTCKHSLNSKNRKMQTSYNSSGYKGVTFKDGRWRSRITVDGKEIYLGKFLSPVDAARKYDTAARMYFGEFAHTNFK